MKKIYIILTHTGTILSHIIRYWTKDEFSHVSIALDADLEEMYSFGRLNPYNPFIGSFVHEHINKGTFKRFKKTQAEVYSIFVTDEQYDKYMEEDAFYEHVESQYSARYGTLRSEVDSFINVGQDVLFDIDWAGAREMREKAGDDVKSPL